MLKIKETLKSLKEFQNLHLDISAIRDTAIIRMAIDEFGSRRIIFGSDFPEERPCFMLNRLKSLNPSESELEDILGGNINKILG